MDLAPLKAAIMILKHHGVPTCIVGALNNYTEYKRGIPRVRTTSWCQPQTILIFTDAFFGFESIEDVLVPPIPHGEQVGNISKEMKENRDDITSLRFPRLAPLLKGVARRYLDTRDDIAMIAVEQLVDGMNLDESWIEKQLPGSDAALLDLIMGRIRSKKQRIDYFMDHKITCFIFDQEEADKVQLIPGYG
ncbi:hypothetical protein E4U41_002020 [Claviceps citrina]|nr:hypothetical protein E4U41_002020 [Claviceps citrina]